AIGAAHALVGHVLDAHGGVGPAHVHADLEEHGDDAGVLADRAVPFGAHARVDPDLRHRVLGRRRLLALVPRGQVPDVVHRVVIADVLQGVGDALDEVFLADLGHGGLLGCGLRRPFYAAAAARLKPFAATLHPTGYARRRHDRQPANPGRL